MVGERHGRFARDDPTHSSPKFAFEQRSRRVWPAREGRRITGGSGCLHFAARPARLSHLHVSPRPVHVTRAGSSTMAGRAQHGCAYGRRLVRSICSLAERPAAKGAAITDF